MYYEARNKALSNNGLFHLAAFASKKGPVGVNSMSRRTAKFKRRYSDSKDTYHEVHAEVDLILRLREVPERINVIRFFKDGTPTMARPCIHCQNFLRIKGVKSVRYTNWNGDWEEMRL